MGLIRERTGLGPLVPGTLNVALAAPYFVTPFATITRQEYNRLEEILLERCCIGGIRAVIMRPDSHERGAAHGPAHLELMAEVRLRDALGLEDGAEVEVVVGEQLLCWEGTSLGGGQ
jgi:CTP-dependent riboflavin kinase